MLQPLSEHHPRHRGSCGWTAGRGAPPATAPATAVAAPTSATAAAAPGCSYGGTTTRCALPLYWQRKSCLRRFLVDDSRLFFSWKIGRIYVVWTSWRPHALHSGLMRKLYVQKNLCDWTFLQQILRFFETAGHTFIYKYLFFSLRVHHCLHIILYLIYFKMSKKIIVIRCTRSSATFWHEEIHFLRQWFC